MHRRLVLLFVSATSLLVAQTNPPPPPATVRVVTPAPAAASNTYALPGRTEPVESARVFTRATGIVQSRAVDIGDLVKAGDTLATIDVPDLNRAVDAARAAFEEAQARAENTRRLAGRTARLFAANTVSQEELDQRQSEAAVADATVRVARADLARLEEQQQFATVRAPFDAVVAARNFDRGDRVRGDSATAEGWLVHLVRVDTLRFVVAATPDLALRLNPGANATVRFNEFPGRTFPATVHRSSKVFDPTGTMRVELLLDNADLSLPAGLTGTVTFELPPASGTWLVPTNTLILTSGKTTLATVKDNRIAFLDVRQGRNLGPTIEVTAASLTTDTAVIVNPNALLRSGDPVAIEPRS